jgi:lipopolysaccharide export LptBFGC system permease protein LptF
MSFTSDNLRRVALRLFWIGAIGFAAFSHFVGGAELWKRVITIGLWCTSAVGACAYAYLFLREYFRK